MRYGTIGIFFVNSTQKEQARNRVPVLFGRATHEAHRARRFKQNRAHFSSLFSQDIIRNCNVAESGPHSPLGDRQARLPGGERANIRASREIPGANSTTLDKKMPISILSKGAETNLSHLNFAVNIEKYSKV
jgi:hypothetical protein